MAKVRVSDLAKQMGIPAKDLLFKLQSLGVQVEDASAAIDHEVIMAILSGKKLATRPRNVIMREDKPVQEAAAKKREIKPPRPIINPPARKSAAAPQPEAPVPVGGPTPIIPEFEQVAEQEAAEQARAEQEAATTPKPRASRAKKAAVVVEAPPEAPAAEEEEPVTEAPAPESLPAEPVVAPAPAARPIAAKSAEPSQPAPSAPEHPAATPAAPAAPHRPAAAAHGHAHAARTADPNSPQTARRVSGPTGPRARAAAAPRPNYQGQQVPNFVPRTPGARPAAGAPGAARPGDVRSARPAGPGAPRPMGPGGARPSTGPGMRPSGPGMRPGGPARPGMRDGGMMPPPTAAPTGTGLRRKKADEEERPEKKKTTGKRGKRAPTVTNEDEKLFSKGPFSAAAVLNDDGEPVSARVEESEEQRRVSSRRDVRKQKTPTAKVLEFTKPTGTVTLTEGVTVKELADKLGVKANDLMKHLLMKKGLMVSINAPLGADLAKEIARDLGLDAEVVSFETAVEIEALERVSSSGAESVSRGPVITVMGHVDHGKTSLLDRIRETNVAGGEAGGITQHIGAYQVEKRGRKIVFLDTPGHEAFTMMRARGAKVTDIVVLVVAADDGVMPQTKEAIDHARAAKVPMIVAINKIDKPNANVDRVRRELSEFGVLVEQWGGEVVSVEVSAAKKIGIDDLLEMILLQSDMLELKATPDALARGVVLEAKKETGRGIVATVLVQDGTLKVGDFFFSGLATGRVRSMTDERGERVKEAAPATPVSVSGFDDMPNAGDSFAVVDEAAQARMIGELRQSKAREQMTAAQKPLSLDALFERMQAGTTKDLNIILKADVQGSAEVLNETLRKLSNDQVKVNILHSSIGAVSTNDVLLASASDAIIIGFNVRPQRDAQELAEKEGVDIRLHTIIYELIDEMKKAMTGLLEPVSKEVFQGRAEVRDTFKVPKIGTIAGCHVTEGTIGRTSGVRLLRDNRVIHEGKIGSLKHFKNDVSEVRTGFDCGIGFERFQDIKVGDIIEAYKIEKTAGVLQS